MKIRCKSALDEILPHYQTWLDYSQIPHQLLNSFMGCEERESEADITTCVWYPTTLFFNSHLFFKMPGVKYQYVAPQFNVSFQRHLDLSPYCWVASKEATRLGQEPNTQPPTIPVGCLRTESWRLYIYCNWGMFQHKSETRKSVKSWITIRILQYPHLTFFLTYVCSFKLLKPVIQAMVTRKC